MRRSRPWQRSALAAIAALAAVPASLALAGTRSAPGSAGPRLVIPAYFDPDTHAATWNRMISRAPAGSIIILDPNNGPYIGATAHAIDQTTDPAALAVQKQYHAQIAALHARGLIAIGYVSTRGGTRPYVPSVDDAGHYDPGVVADITEWRTRYGVDGIFLDEGPGAGTWDKPLPAHKDFTSGRQHGAYPHPGVTTGRDYYMPIFRAIRNAFPTGPILLNPGIPTDEGYMNVCTILCDVEEGYKAYRTDAWLQSMFTPESWCYRYPPERFAQLVHGLPASADAGTVRALIDQATRWHAGYVYVTDVDGWTDLAGDVVWNAETAR